MLVSVSTMPAGNDAKKYALQIDDFADFLHCDVCDGAYNQTECFSADMASQINSATTLPLDVHLMTKNPLLQAKQYVKAGANIVTAQYESFENQQQIVEFVDFVKSTKTLVGLAIEPSTDVDVLLPFLSRLDVVLIMAVKTGKSGQKFDGAVLQKIKKLALSKGQYNFKIQVDGGIDSTIAQTLKQLGVDIVVSGNYVFKSSNFKDAISSLK